MSAVSRRTQITKLPSLLLLLLNVCFSKLLSDEGHLEALIFATFDMLQFYKIYGVLIILDTTFGLNRFNMPLLTIAGVKNDGKTIILGFALVLNETFEYKLWALKEYLKFVNDEQATFCYNFRCLPCAFESSQGSLPSFKDIYMRLARAVKSEKTFLRFEKDSSQEK